MGFVQFTTPDQETQSNSINVSSYGDEPYRIFSPFSSSPSYRIPVPGQEQLRSSSVESIWQGLKIINGQTDFSLFERTPRKRAGRVEGHQYGQEVLGYQEARRQIYLPAYTYHVVNNALDVVKDNLEVRLQQGTVTFYDVESNGDINDLSRPYAHASLLSNLLDVLLPAPLPPFSRERFANLSEQVTAVLDYRQALDEQQRFLLDEIISFAYLFSQDDLKATFALRTLQEGTIPGRHRLQHYFPTAKTSEPYEALRR